MAVIEWTSSWLGHRASTTELSLCPQHSLVCSCFAPFLCFSYDRHWIQVLRLCPCINLGNVRWSWQWYLYILLCIMLIICIIAIICIIQIMCIIAIILIMSHYFGRMVGISWFQSGIRAWLQETYPVCHSHTEYPGKTSCSTRRWQWNYSAPLAQRLSGRSRWPQAGFGRWMPDVVRQLVGVRMVPGYVMNGEGFSAVKTSICPHIPLW